MILSYYGIISDRSDTSGPRRYRFSRRHISGHDAAYVLFDPDKNQFYVDELGKTWGTKRFQQTNVVENHPILKNTLSHGLSHGEITLPNFLEHIKKNHDYTEIPIDVLINGELRPNVRAKFMGMDPELPVLTQTKKTCYGVSHHVAHAYSGFIQSPFKGKIASLSMDGGSHDGMFMYGYFDENAKYHYNRRGYKPGLVYTLHNVTTDWWRIQKILGGSDMEISGKLMGLSAYGTFNEEFYNAMLRQYEIDWDSSRYCTWDESPFSNKIDEMNINELKRDASQWITQSVIDCPTLNKWRTLSRQALKEKDDIKEFVGDKEITNFAHNTQLAFEQFVIKFLKTDGMKKILDDCNGQLIMTGGCALNVLANQRIRDELGIDVWVPPHCDDSGQSIGIMSEHLFSKKIVDPSFRYDLTFKGRFLNNSKSEIEHHINTKFKRITIPDLVEHLTNGKIIGFISGRSEIGPRALGHRSILCDPSFPNMKQILNKKIKHREWFRPFAPICRKEDAATYFEAKNFGDMSYMSFAVKTKPKYSKILSAVTHVDGTARLQTVDKNNEETEIIYNILTSLPKHKVLINTSFNSNIRREPNGKLIKYSEPNINDLQRAFAALQLTDLDYVVLHYENELWLTEKSMCK